MKKLTDRERLLDPTEMALHRVKQERARERQLKRLYGLSLDAYQVLLESQNGTCFICQKPPTMAKPLVVDHNHDTGVIRGLLCSSCNWALGGLQDSSVVCRRAAEYLELSGC